MLNKKIITYLKDKNWWFDDVSASYESALCSIGLDLDSDISNFYLHAEDGATFYSRNHEIYQICWFILNSDYKLLIESAKSVYGLSDDYIPLNDLSNGTYFYNKKDRSVIFLEDGDIFVAFKNGESICKWNDFSLFIDWYFEISFPQN